MTDAQHNQAKAISRKDFLTTTLAGAMALPATVGAAAAPAGTAETEGNAQLVPPDRIVLIVIDTLRADHVGCYGYFRNTTPFLDSLASQGTLFRRAYSSSSNTSPSHASLFTALHPLQHGLTTNGLALDPQFSMMAEFLHEKGYQTAGFVSSHHFVVGGMSRGFDTFSEPGTEGLVKDLYRPAAVTVDLALDWLKDRKPDDRFFLWVHLFDPHGPRVPPEEYRAPFAEETDRNREAVARRFIYEHHTDFDFWKHKVNYLVGTLNDYDGEVLYADTQLKRLYTLAQEHGLNSNALWIATADHGEGLGNHHFVAHERFIYNEQLHVPLIFHMPGSAPRVVDNVVELVDVFPTIAALHGVPLAQHVQHTQGVSLLPYLRKGGSPLLHKQYAFSERRTYSEILRPAENDPYGFYKFEEGERYALQDQHFKYISWSAGDDEFYDLDEDPYEVKNVRGLGTEREREMRQQLRELAVDLQGHYDAETIRIDEENIERLRALGYLL